MNIWECKRYCDRRLIKKNVYQILEKTNIGRLSAKVANNHRMHSAVLDV